jgi:hypothetical protein
VDAAGSASSVAGRLNGATAGGRARAGGPPPPVGVGRPPLARSGLVAVLVAPPDDRGVDAPAHWASARVERQGSELGIHRSGGLVGSWIACAVNWAWPTRPQASATLRLRTRPQPRRASSHRGWYVGLAASRRSTRSVRSSSRARTSPMVLRSWSSDGSAIHSMLPPPRNCGVNTAADPLTATRRDSRRRLRAELGLGHN